MWDAWSTPRPGSFTPGKENRFGGVDWMELAQDRDRWGALVNAVMRLRVPKKCVEFLD